MVTRVRTQRRTRPCAASPFFTARAPSANVERNLEPVVYTAVKRFDPETRPDWPKFIAWSRLAKLREVVSLEQLLCPNWFHDLIAEDWDHNVHENFKTQFFHDPDHVAARAAGQAVNVLALIEEPSTAAIASFRDARFVFCGFDLVEEGGGISALVNCGGFRQGVSAWRSLRVRASRRLRESGHREAALEDRVPG